MSTPGHCDRCGRRVDHHRPSKHVDHAFACSDDDATRVLRAARREGMTPDASVLWTGAEDVDGCVSTGCLQGRHGAALLRDHEYAPPPATLLLERMRDRRARRILRRVAARGTWEVRGVYRVWIDPDTVYEDAWGVERTYGDWSTMLTVTRERLGISKFAMPEREGSRWWMYSDEHDVTVWIARETVGTLVRP